MPPFSSSNHSLKPISAWVLSDDMQNHYNCFPKKKMSHVWVPMTVSTELCWISWTWDRSQKNSVGKKQKSKQILPSVKTDQITKRNIFRLNQKAVFSGRMSRNPKSSETNSRLSIDFNRLWIRSIAKKDQILPWFTPYIKSLKPWAYSGYVPRQNSAGELRKEF